MKKILWSVAVIGSALGTVLVLLSVTLGGDVRTAATVGIALAVIPCCLAHAFSEFHK